MTINLLLLITGMSFLIFGGDLLVKGASSIAEKSGVPHLIIGLTVVAFGTSAPELAVNVLASLQGNSDISFGNIMGSNIANIALILGCSALFRPLTIEGVIISREIPMLILATLLVLIAGSDMILNNQPDVFNRSDGMIFLLIFCVFIYYTFTDAARSRKSDPIFDQTRKASDPTEQGKLILDFVFVLIGFAGLIGGAKLTVNSAVYIAEAFNVPQVIIGLTIVAIGTSLPELVTSIIATWKGYTDLAVGNVVGSNIFNLLLVTGTSSTLSPVEVPAHGGRSDLYAMTLLTIFLLPLCMTNQKKIVRWEGAVLLVFYFGYNAWRVL